MTAGARTPARVFARAWVTGAGLAILLFGWMVSAGTWQFTPRQPQGGFYEAQARSLLHLHWDVSPQVLNVEAFIVHGKAYMYFGPVPALMRLPVVALTDGLDGRLTELSLLAAFVVSLGMLGRLAWRARRAVLGDTPMGTGEAWISGALALVFGSGSILLFLASHAFVYHEAILWAVAFSLAAYDQMVAYVERPTPGRVVGAATFATLAVLTRFSVGLGAVAALLVLGLWEAFRWRRVRPEDPMTLRPAAACLLTGVLSLSLYAYVNEAKFGTLFSIPVKAQAYNGFNAGRREALRANGGTLFGPQFLPTTLLQYARPDALRVGRLFPWFRYPPLADVIGDVRFDLVDRSSSVPASMPLLTVLALVGAVAIVRPPRRTPQLAAFRIPLLGAAVGSGGVLTIAYVTQRYLGDVFPVLALGAVVAAPVLGSALAGRSRRARAGVLTALATLALLSVAANIALTLWSQRAFSGDDRLVAPFVRFQRDLDARLLGGRAGGVRRAPGPGLGHAAPEGTIEALGNCDGTYWSDGQQWFALERTNRTGHYRLRVRFGPAAPGTTEPLATGGEPGQRSILAAERLGGRRVRFRYGSKLGNSPVHWFSGNTLAVADGRLHDVDLVFDRIVLQARVTVDGRSGVEPLYVLSPGPHIQLGAAEVGDGVASRFTGTIRNLPVGSPFCERLVKRELASALFLPGPSTHPAGPRARSASTLRRARETVARKMAEKKMVAKTMVAKTMAEKTMAEKRTV